MFSCFLHGDENWDQIYLATFPRSGNHWMRFLIEEATHIATSSSYCDFGGIHMCDSNANHMSILFPWGGYCVQNGYSGKCRYPIEGEPAVIKTHFPFYEKQPHESETHTKTIVIIRNPIDTFYSHYIYMYPDQKSEIISLSQIRAHVSQWKNFYNYWKDQPGILLLRYEDMLENPHEILRKTLNYIGYTVSEEDLLRAVQNYPPLGTIGKHMPFYSHEALEWMEKELSDLLDEFKYRLIDSTSYSIQELEDQD